MNKKALYGKVNHCVRLFYFLVIFLSFARGYSATAHSYDSIPSDLKLAYEELINLRLEKSKAYLEQFQKKGQFHPFEIYLTNYTAVIDLFLNGNEEEYKKGKSIEDRMLDKISTLDDSIPYKYFLKSEVRLQWALAKIKFDSEFQALWSLRRAWFAARNGFEKYPNYEPLWKSYGLLKVTFGAIPDKYQWIAGLLGLNGDIHEGLRYLENLYGSNNILAVESGLILALLHAYYYNDYDKSNLYLNQLRERIPKSLLQTFLHASLLIKESESEKALILLETFENADYSKTGYTSIPYVSYMKGEIHLQKGEYNRAINSYETFIKMHKGKNTLKDAQFKIAMCYWLLDDMKKAQTQIQDAAKIGQTINEVDKNADFMIRQGKLPDQILLKIRYSTDGGYYLKADSLIQTTRISRFTEKKDRVEFIYRHARLNHKMKNLESATSEYHKVIEQQGNESWYYAPNSCLQLGYIYKSENKTEHAIAFFEQAASYKGHAYVNSIRQKAKLELSEINP